MEFVCHRLLRKSFWMISGKSNAEQKISVFTLAKSSGQQAKKHPRVPDPVGPKRTEKSAKKITSGRRNVLEFQPRREITL